MDCPDDCTTCGACCFFSSASHIRVFARDRLRLGPMADQLLVQLEGGWCMRELDSHCAALQVHGASGRLVCRVYDARPDVCRALAPGSSLCAAEVRERRQQALACLARCANRSGG